MKKHLLLLMAAIGLLAIPTTSYAITVDDLDGKTCAQIFAGNHAENGLPRVGSSGKFRKINSTTVAVDNFYDDYTVTFTLRNNQLTLNVGSLSNPTEYSRTDGRSGYLVMYNTVGYSSTFTNSYTGAKTNYYRYQPTSQSSTFTSKAYADLGARGSGFLFDSSSNSSCYFAFVPDDDDDAAFVFYNFSLIVQDNNGYAIEEDGTTYPVKYDITDSNIDFLNFYDLGVPYSIDFANTKMAFSPTISATKNNDGNFTIPAQIVGGSREARYHGYNQSSIDLGDRGTAYPSPNTGWAYTNYPLMEYNFLICSNNNGTGSISGKAYTNPVNHVTSSTNWVSDKALKTYKGDVLKIGNIKMFDSYDRGILKSTSSILFVRDLNAEVTHNLTIKKKEYGYGKIHVDNPDTYIYLNCELDNFKNSDYVKDYELYIVPSVGNNPDYTSSNFADDNGHVNGTRIDLPEYVSDFTPSDDQRTLRAMAAGEEEENVNPFEGYKYNILIPENDLKAKNTSGNYQLYVKTIYTDESGLEPTFHALTSLGNTTTGVENIIKDNVDDENAPAVYYNLNGVRTNGDALTPGIYIRRQGSTTSKVVIR